MYAQLSLIAAAIAAAITLGYYAYTRKPPLQLSELGLAAAGTYPLVFMFSCEGTAGRGTSFVYAQGVGKKDVADLVAAFAKYPMTRLPIESDGIRCWVFQSAAKSISVADGLSVNNTVICNVLRGGDAARSELIELAIRAGVIQRRTTGKLES